MLGRRVLGSREKEELMAMAGAEQDVGVARPLGRPMVEPR
jgi:hypothetical protein